MSTKEAGVVCVRTIRRRVLSERWNATELAQLQGAPWDLRLLATTADDAIYDPERHAVPEPNQSPAVILDAKGGPVKASYVTKNMIER